MHFAGKFSRGPCVYERSLPGVTYLLMRIHLNSCCIFRLKVATTSLNGSRNGTVEGYMLILQSLMYIEGNGWTDGAI